MRSKEQHPSLLLLENLHLVSHAPVQPEYIETAGFECSDGENGALG